MFKFEKDMIPVLIKHLSHKYKTCHFVDEFNSGNGIADLVFTTNIQNKDNIKLLDYELLHTVLRHFNRINKKIEVDKLIAKTSLTKKRINALIEILVEHNLIEHIHKNTFYIKKKYSPPIKRMISIEAKLHDWKSGFQQALRYKTYSHKSYLAISKEFSHRVDRKLLKKHNIGLMVVYPDKVDIELNTIIQKPLNSIAHAYLSEKMALTLSGQ